MFLWILSIKTNVVPIDLRVFELCPQEMEMEMSNLSILVIDILNIRSAALKIIELFFKQH